MTPEETYELIEKYLHGDLSETELKVFEQRLTNDQKLSEELEIHRMAFELVIDGGVLKAKEKLNRIHQAETGRVKSWKWKIYLSGLLLATLIGVGIYYYKSTKEQIATLTSNSTSQSSVAQSKIIPLENNVISVTKEKTSTKKNIIAQKEIINSSISVLNDTATVVQKKETENVIKDLKSLDTITIHSAVSKIDCSTVEITGKVDSKASCTQEASGVIVINLGTVRGGTKPYRYSISEDDGYGVSSQYNQLSPGQYTVKVKDKNGCSSVLQIVTIESSECPKEYAFAPSRGEEWTIPVNKSLAGEIKIVDRKGTKVYVSSFDNGEVVTWTGLDMYGQELPSDMYLFFILYTNGNSQQGHITILK